MADLGILATKQSLKGLSKIVFPRLTMRSSVRVKKAWTASSWSGNSVLLQKKTLSTKVTRLLPYSWWGLLPEGSAQLLPNYKMEGHVLQENVPLSNVRVALFFRRTNYLVDMKVTDSLGYFKFENLMYEPQGYYAIAFDPEGSPLQNSLIWDRLTPVAM